MTSSIGRNINTNDTTIKTGPRVAVAAVTIKLLDANPDRIIYRVSNPSNKDVWIKEQAAAVDNLQEGDVFLPKNSVYESPTDNPYTGEVSVISTSGAAIVHGSEY